MRYLLLIVCFLTCSLFASDYSDSHNWYMKTGIGLNYLDLMSKSDDRFVMKTGIYSNVTVGYQFEKNLHSELEFGHRKNSALLMTDGMTDTMIGGTLSTYTGLISIVLDFPFQQIFVLSVGAGTGVCSTEGKITAKYYEYFDERDPTKLLMLRSEGVTMQGLLRVLVKFTDRFGMCLEYKYLNVPSVGRHNTLGINCKVDF